MDNIKKQGEEELKRALLMMKYDNRNTLSENYEKIIIKEQASTTIVTDTDLLGNTNLLRSYFQTVAGDYNIFDTMGLNTTNIIAGRRAGVKGVVDALDGWVDENDLAFVLGLVGGLKGKCYEDDTQNPPVKVPAIKRFLELYSEDEGGDDLISDVQSVGTTTLRTGSEKLKSQIVNTINQLQQETCEASTEGNVDDSGKSLEDNKADQVDEPKVPGEDDEYKNTKFRRFIDKSEVER